MSSVLKLGILWAGLCLVGCIKKSEVDDTGGAGDGGRVEGQHAGDCSDAADNDLDGLFDCDDDGCSGSPDCASDQGGGDDGGSGDDGSGDDGSGDDGSGGEDTGDTGATPPDATTIASAAWGCSEADQTFQYELYTSGWATGGVLFIYQYVKYPWDEEHPVDVVESDDGGFWSRLYLELESVYPDVGEVVFGETTLYACGEAYGSMEETLNFVFTVDDEDERDVDCVLWGIEPDAVADSGCREITASSLR